MLTIGIQSNIDQVTQAFDKMAQGQVPFATSVALNKMAKIVRDQLQGAMMLVFDRPTPYTINSLYILYSTKTNLTARVEHKDFAGKGTPASKYLRPEIEGGSRTQKRSEVVFARLAGMPGGFWTPGPGARLNSYGNVSPAQITQILSAVGGLSESGFLGNRTDASAKRKGAALKEYFIIPVNNPRGLAPGVYERKAGRIIPVLFLIPKATYRPRYDMQGIAEKAIAQRFDQIFAESLDYALSTARVSIK